MSEDIKHAFDSVFTDEPPLSIHRDEVLRAGRTRLRHRRLAVVSGFAAVVMTAVFGAALLTGTNGAEGVDSAGNGFGGSPDGCVVESAVPRPTTTAPPKPCEPTTPEHAQALTTALAEGDVVPAELTTRGSGYGLHPDPLVFVPERAKYTASADLVAADGQAGTLYVMIGGKTSNSSRSDCKPPAECEFRTVNGEDVQVTTWPLGTSGEVYTMVSLQRVDGTQVYAMVSNVAATTTGSVGKGESAPTIDHQPLTPDQLVKLVTLPGLRF